MANRQLTKEEKELTRKGIANFSQEIADLRMEQKVRKAQEKYLKAKEEYEELLRPFNKAVEEKEMKERNEIIESTIKAKEYSIAEMNKHLKDGVPIKENHQSG